MNKNKIFITLAIILIIFSIGIRLLSIDKDISAEESDFLKPAISLMETGHPIYYNSEQLKEELALWHPPMFLFSLSFISNFINIEIGARALNIFYSILTSFLIFLLAFKLSNKENKLFTGLLSSLIFLISYYSLSSSLLIDLDTSSALFIFIFISSLILARKENNYLYYFPASLSLTLALFNRYPIAILAFGVSFLYFIKKDFKEKNKNHSKFLFFSGLISIITFLLIWSFYSVIIEPNTFFSFINHNAKLGISQISSFKVYLVSFLINITQLIRLNTLPFIILSFLAISYYIKHRKEEFNLYILSSLTIIIFFILLPRPAFGYPRYFFSALPLLIIPLSFYINETLSRIKNKELKLSIIISIMSLIIILLLKPIPVFYTSKGLILSSNFFDLISYILPVLTLFLIIFMRNKRIIFITSLFLIFILQSAYLSVIYLQHDSQTKEVGEFIKSVTSENDILISPKAVGYYSQRKFYNNDNNKPSFSLSKDYIFEYLSKTYNSPNMDDKFFWPNDVYGGLYPPYPSKEELSEIDYAVTYYPLTDQILIKKLGDFYVYKIKYN